MTQKYKKVTIKVKAEEYDEIIALLDVLDARLTLTATPVATGTFVRLRL